MSFRTLIPGGASSNGATFGFSVNSRGKGLKELRFSICPAIMRKTKWTADTLIALNIDDEEKKGELAVVSEGAFQARKLKITGSTQRGLFIFPYSGEALEVFQEYEGIYELDNVVATPEAITFDLPPAPEHEEEDAEEAEES